MVEIFDDIRQLYRFYTPANELAGHVEFFSESCMKATRQFAGGSPFTIKMFPSWSPTVWINLGPHYTLQLGDRRYSIPSGSGILLTRDVVAERHNLPADHLFSIKFYPGGLERVLRINQSHFNGRIENLERVFPVQLIDQMKGAAGFAERVRLCEDHFLHRMNRQATGDHYLTLIQQTIVTYTASGMAYNVNQLSERLFTTSKTINRYFQKAVGATPKTYFSVLRARTALSAYLRDRVAFDPSAYGYCDKSHLYKDVMKFTGKRLSEQA